LIYCFGQINYVLAILYTLTSFHFSQGKYLQKQPTSSFVQFGADKCGTPYTRFVLFFHQQNQEQPGIMVDIQAMANANSFYRYLAKSKQADSHILEANSNRIPDDKFLIIPVLDGQ
jgi:hypothetical protein